MARREELALGGFEQPGVRVVHFAALGGGQQFVDIARAACGGAAATGAARVERGADMVQS